MSAAAALAVSGACAAGAAAQVLSSVLPAGVPGYGDEAGVTVASRLRPETEPQGLRAGAFIIKPALEEAVGAASSVPAGAAQGSAVIATRPSLLMTSDWSRDAVGVRFGAENIRYPGAANQDETNWDLSGGGSADIGRDRLTLSAAHVAAHQDQGAIGALATSQPVAFRVEDIRASYALGVGRLTITPGLEFSLWRFDEAVVNGVPVNQSYRDRNAVLGSVVVSYELAPLRNLLLVTRANGQNSTSPQPGVPVLNATGYSVLGGFDYDGDAVWRYRLLAGMASEYFTAFPSHTAPVAAAEVAWMPTGLTTFYAALTRSMEDAAQEGVAGFVYTRLALHMDHEYRRDVILRASAMAQRADFFDSGGHQTQVGAGAGATWLLSRRVHLLFDTEITRQTGTPTGGLTGNYTRATGLLTLRLGL